MTIYRYDGSFEGFLCAVAECLDAGDNQPEFVQEGDSHAVGLFAGDTCEVETVRDRAVAFRARFVETVSQYAFATGRYAFHSQKAGIERLVWLYLKLGLEVRGRLGGMLTVEPVHSINRIARRVSHEAHKFKGFVRFRDVEAGFLYAQIEPEADILTFIQRRRHHAPWQKRPQKRAWDRWIVQQQKKHRLPLSPRRSATNSRPSRSTSRARSTYRPTAAVTVLW